LKCTYLQTLQAPLCWWLCNTWRNARRHPTALYRALVVVVVTLQRGSPVESGLGATQHAA